MDGGSSLELSNSGGETIRLIKDADGTTDLSNLNLIPANFPPRTYRVGSRRREARPSRREEAQAAQAKATDAYSYKVSVPAYV